ncbi:MAG: EAL domain-containing protein [Candidatus Nanopelagicales bacterium]
MASLLALPITDHPGRLVVLAVTSQRPNAFAASDDNVLASLVEFLRRALDIASELARVTTVLLASSHSEEQRLQSARFVAEVMRPGLVDDIVGHRRVRDVLETTSLEMVVQPIADMGSGEVRMAEALARFSASPRRGPDQWFAEAHRVGLGLHLELAAVQGALDLIASLPDSVALTVNVAPVVLASGGLLELVDQTLHPRLVLEITEHHTIDPLSLLGPIERVREAGVRIAIDDTGSGYATLSALLRIKPDIIKLDRDLVRGIDQDPVRRAMARALVQFTREDGPADLVAEGIETEAEANALVELGVTMGQGYFLGHPGPVSQLPQSISWRARTDSGPT